MSTITYSGFMYPAVTVELGRRPDVNREGNCEDVYIQRKLAIDCPLILSLLIRKDGTAQEWDAEFSGNANVYWHLVHEHRYPITDAQRRTLAAIHYGTVKPFGVSGGLGRTACDLAFAGLTHDEAEALGGVEPGSVAYNG